MPDSIYTTPTQTAVLVVLRTSLRERAIDIGRAERWSRRIAHELMSEPPIASRRISVHQDALVEERGVDTEAVADRYDPDVAGLSRPRTLPRAPTGDARRQSREEVAIGSFLSRPTVQRVSVRTGPEMGERPFLLEEDIDPKVATYLAKEALDAADVRDTLGQGAADADDVLPSAREQDRAIVTSDVKGFGSLPPDSHAGIILLCDDTMAAYRVAAALL